MEGRGSGKSKDVTRSVSEVGVAVLALVKCECDESPGAKKNRHWGMGIIEGKNRKPKASHQAL